MREPEQTLGRSCVRPEVSRTRTFGAKGVSGGQWWKQHLQYIVLNPNPVDFSSKNLSYITEVCFMVPYAMIDPHTPPHTHTAGSIRGKVCSASLVATIRGSQRCVVWKAVNTEGGAVKVQWQEGL